ncbi:MAG: hypothetical protein LAP40_25545 [Acidobacteriia bacterium]|nr:hypothetical protein [Terriglobia bacterium]
MPELDDATVAYILETRPCFEDLRQVASQLAGLLVLEAAGAKSELPRHPMLAAAEELYGGAAGQVRRARVTARTERHHHHLMQATEEIGSALRAARLSVAIDPMLVPLRRAYAQLQGAARELPGFEMVEFQQGCCGARRRDE